MLAGKRLVKNYQGNMRWMLAYALPPGQQGNIKMLKAPLREREMVNAL